MPFINVSELITDPDFAQAEPFQLLRNYVHFEKGDAITDQQSILMEGIIIPTNTKDMKQSGDGDAITGSIAIYTGEALNTTAQTDVVYKKSQISDEIIWDDQRWKILQVSNRIQNGFYKAIAVRKETA